MDFTELSLLTQRMDHRAELGKAELGAAVAELRRPRSHMLGRLARFTRHFSQLQRSDVVGAQSLQRGGSHAGALLIGHPGLSEHSPARGHS